MPIGPNHGIFSVFIEFLLTNKMPTILKKCQFFQMVNHLEHRPSHGQLPLDLLAHGGVQVVGLHVGQLGPGHDGLALDAGVHYGVLCNRETELLRKDWETKLSSLNLVCEMRL